MNIKKKIKRKLNSGQLPCEEELWERVRSFQHVSFDCFDTLLKRNVDEATDVFRLMEYICAELPKGFAKGRVEAEQNARKKLNNNHQEITIEEIYDCYEGLTEEQKQRYINCEKLVEQKLLVTNIKVVELYKRCIENGKNVYILTDTYMPLEFIKQVLKRNGIDEYKQIYVSSEKQMVKVNGTMFESFLAKNNLDAKSVIHIGDSRKSDYVQARKRGLSAVCIPRYRKDSISNARMYMDNIQINYLHTFANNTYEFLRSETSDVLREYTEFGYKKFGPLLLGFVKWIHKKAIEENIQKLYFFSRDGLVIKRAFDVYYKEESMKTYYLEVSRKSLRVPILWMDFSYETIVSMLSTSKLISINSIFDGLGLDIDYYETLLLTYGLSKDTVFESKTLLEEKKLRKIIETIKEEIIERSHEQFDLLRNYLQQNNVCGKFGVVDIGYAGSMQRYLEQALDAMNVEHDIQGYYVGVAAYHKKNVEAHRDMSMYGYLFDCKNSPEDIDNRSGFVGLFEMLFLEQGGSVESYYADDSCGIKAKRADSEYMDGDKLSHEAQKIFALQKGALQFVESSLNDELLSEMDIAAKNAFWGIERTGNSPNMKDINLFGDFAFVDEGNKTKLANPKGMLYYLFHMKQLKYDFLMCRWKIGFLKKLFKIELPYMKIYQLLLRFR